MRGSIVPLHGGGRPQLAHEPDFAALRRRVEDLEAEVRDLTRLIILLTVGGAIAIVGLAWAFA